ncbi:ABC transporter permease [Massilibacterium senegalense]|uniref:ABC transporter permease n=1 Tax=Massilibacterium senegalense TaxID=1632858 RepID=UPI0007815A02|nr:ABC transporter permease [Massilibacterium senegalense]
MNIWESFKMSLSSILSHKLRSFLTMLGIIIGVGSVIIVVALGQGAENEIKESVVVNGKNVVDLQFTQEESEDSFGGMYVEMPTLTQDEINLLKKGPLVKNVFGSNDMWGEATFQENKMDVQALGITPGYMEAQNVQMIYGRPLTEKDLTSTNRTVIIDEYTQEKLFKNEEEVLGQVIELMGEPFRVVGVYKSIVPETFRFNQGQFLMSNELLSAVYNIPEINTLSIQAKNPDDMMTAGQQAADLLNRTKEIEGGYFEPFDMGEIEAGIQSVTRTMTMLIGGIAGISLLVGGIGVMNIMLVSVTERTREIGLRKALGATRGKILLQFLIESATLTTIGGIIGILFAAGVCALIAIFAPFTPVISIPVIIVGVLFSMFVGIVFGVIPANKAAKLNPIDALRYE